jgi:hypothetical protein
VGWRPRVALTGGFLENPPGRPNSKYDGESRSATWAETREPRDSKQSGSSRLVLRRGAAQEDLGSDEGPKLERIMAKIDELVARQGPFAAKLAFLFTCTLLTVVGLQPGQVSLGAGLH